MACDAGTLVHRIDGECSSRYGRGARHRELELLADARTVFEHPRSGGQIVRQHRRKSDEVDAPLRADDEPPDLGARWRRGEPQREALAARETRGPLALGLACR